MTTKKKPEFKKSLLITSNIVHSKWLDRLNELIDKHLGDPSLNNERLAAALGLSERHLFRKIKEFTAVSPQKYLSKYRLHRAKQYLEAGKYRTVKETSAAVGFRHTSYFIRRFEKEFGNKPLFVLRNAGWR